MIKKIKQSITNSIKRKTDKIFDYLSNLLSLLKIKATSNLGNKINSFTLEYDTLNDENNIAKLLNTIKNFYKNDFEIYCKQHNLDEIKELEFRKTELLKDIDHMANIFTGILIGLVTPYIISFIKFIYKYTESKYDSIAYSILFAVLWVLICFIAFMIPLTIKLIIKYLRNDIGGYNQFIKNFELKIIADKIDKKYDEMINFDVTNEDNL